MNTVRVKLPAASRSATDWSALRHELGVVTDFSPDAMVEAAAVAQNPTVSSNDRTDVPLFTLDPKGSVDLDQAMYLERDGDGFRITYAIADVGAFVRPGGALDAATHERGETLYGPDIRVPLLPTLLSEGAASLLPQQTSPAILWTLELDATGELGAASATRAMVRSTQQLDYDSVQQTFDNNQPSDQMKLLSEIGKLRQERARDRGAVDIATAEQIVTDGPDGTPVLAYRAERDVEKWNAQVSLLTGMAAARMMLQANVGILRTLPPPHSNDIEQLRRSATALGLNWQETTPYGDFVSALDPAIDAEAAMLNLSARLLRGASYVAFDGEQPAQAVHSAVAAHYAHCTAPLRRLVDRYVSEICVALSTGADIPQWVHDALPKLPEEMASADRRAHALERATIDLAEALVLQPRTGEEFDAVVVDLNPKGAVVQITEPAVRARCTGTGLVLGRSVRVRLIESDPVKRIVTFEPVDTPLSG